MKAYTLCLCLLLSLVAASGEDGPLWDGAYAYASYICTGAGQVRLPTNSTIPFTSSLSSKITITNSQFIIQHSGFYQAIFSVTNIIGTNMVYTFLQKNGDQVPSSLFMMWGNGPAYDAGGSVIFAASAGDAINLATTAPAIQCNTTDINVYLLSVL